VILSQADRLIDLVASRLALHSGRDGGGVMSRPPSPSLYSFRVIQDGASSLRGSPARCAQQSDRVRSLSIETLSLKASGRKDPPILQGNQESDRSQSRPGVVGPNSW
jgi:hypothetical protein